MMSVVMIRSIPTLRRYFVCKKNLSFQIKVAKQYELLQKVILNLKMKTKDSAQNLSQSYEEITGLQDVKRAQDQVFEESGKLTEYQKNRRLMSTEVDKIHGMLKAIHSELNFIKKTDDRYVKLIVEENELLKLEESVKGKLKEAEELEKEQLVKLTNAVRFSYDKERLQSNKFKFYSFIASLIGAVLGFIGSSINHYIKLSHYNKLQSDIEKLTDIKNLQDTWGKSKLNSLEESVRDILQILSSTEEQKIYSFFKSVNSLIIDLFNNLCQIHIIFFFLPSIYFLGFHLTVIIFSIYIIVASNWRKKSEKQ